MKQEVVVISQMNREQRRKLIKEFEKTGLTNAQAKRLLEIHEAPDLKGSFKEGDRVRLNVKSIQEHPDYPNMNPMYKQWVGNNKDKEFTVEYDEKQDDNPTLVCLKEDTTDPKWLWWVGNLEKVRED